MVVATAIPYENELLPKQFNEKTAEITPDKLPNIRFRGWAKGLFSIQKEVPLKQQMVLSRMVKRYK